MPTLELKNVCYAYEKGKAVLSEINAELETGKLYAILVPSGSGKTTLLALLGGLDTPTQGSVLFDGENIRTKGLEYHRKNHISLIFQSYNLVPVLNVYENIVLPIELDGNDVDKSYVNQIVEVLGLGSKLNSLPSQLSGGQQQRVAIARALATKPAIILADEPTGNLDSHTSQDVLGLLKVTGEKFGQTIVMITHNEEIAQMADRIIRIEDGRIVKGGEADA